MKVPRTSVVNKSCFLGASPALKVSMRGVSIRYLVQWDQHYTLILTNSFSSSQYNFVAEVGRMQFAVSSCVYLQHFRVYNQVLSSFFIGLYLCSIHNCKNGIFFPFRACVYICCAQGLDQPSI